MRRVAGQVVAYIPVYAEVDDDATVEQIETALIDACPIYPMLKDGVNFDSDDMQIIDSGGLDEIVASDHEAALLHDTERDGARLADLEVAFEEAGGRGVEMAEEIDALRSRLHPPQPLVLVLKGRGDVEVARFDVGVEDDVLVLTDEQDRLLLGIQRAAEDGGVTFGHWPGGEEWEVLADLYPPTDDTTTWVVEQ